MEKTPRILDIFKHEHRGGASRGRYHTRGGPHLAGFLGNLCLVKGKKWRLESRVAVALVNYVSVVEAVGLWRG